MTIVERLRTTGLRRLGTPASGFRWRRPGGTVTAADLERIRALRIPPAWTDVAVSLSPRAPVQAVGRDAAGRDQYVYHDAHVARRELRRELRLLRFVRVLPRMRARVARDLARPGLDRHKVLAVILTVLSRCFFRPGSEQYADQNGSYGLATLRRRHVGVTGDLVRFDFEGKSGRRHSRELRDRRVARVVRELLRHPGEVFKFRDGSGHLRDVRTTHINAYIKEVMGEAFSAKDFRTWAANLLSASAFALSEPAGDSERETKRRVAAVVREVADHLGNTPAVCRASYILDSVIRHYRKGRVARRSVSHLQELVEGRPAAVDRAERALVALLRARRRHPSGRDRAGVPPARRRLTALRAPADHVPSHRRQAGHGLLHP